MSHFDACKSCGEILEEDDGDVCKACIRIAEDVCPAIRSGSLDALQILSLDRDAWKARAEAAEKDAARWRTTSEENEDIALAAEKRARDIESELVDTRVELEAAQGSNDVLAAKLEAAERETKRHQARADEWIHACLEAFPSPSHVGRDVRAFRVKQDVESLRNELADAERMTEGLTIAAVIAWLEKRAYDGNEHEIALMVDAIARGDWRPKGREGGE